MSGGNWEIKKFKDCFQINYLAIIFFIVLILFEISDRIAKNNKKIHKER
jgi:hypothetical protein